MAVTKLLIAAAVLVTVTTACKTVVYLGHNSSDVLTKCWDLDGNWYGGGTEINQKFPIQFNKHRDAPAIVGSKDTEAFNVLSRYWLHSYGITIKVEDDVPLFFKMDDYQMCLTAKNAAPYNVNAPPPKLAYTFCRSDNLTNVFLANFRFLFSLPKMPDEQFFLTPTWSTWPKLQGKGSSETVTTYATLIKNAVGADRSTINIVKDWESCIGEFHFNSNKFPNPKQLVQQLKSLGFSIALTATPFVGTKCESLYKEGGNKGYFVRNRIGSPSISDFEGSTVASLDFTKTDDPTGIQWWAQRLQNLQTQYGIDSFFFANGQSSWLSDDAVLSEGSPNSYSENYMAVVSATFGKKTVVSLGTPSQRLPAFVQMQPKESSFTYNGLQTVIPTVLQMGLAGFPFILPDVAGGSGSGSKTPPDKNLFIRWLQVNTLLPSTHFSFQPLDYGDDVNNIAIKMFNLRKKYLTLILQLAKQAVQDGSPIIRPLWWITPLDPTAQTIGDQFLLGNDLMVAPIVTNSTQRDIYFPNGTSWYDEVNNKTITESGTKTFNVEIDQLLYFTRLP